MTTLKEYLQAGNTIPAARCSSAMAKGRGKNYAYWGAAEYRISWSRSRAAPVALCVKRATSDRRSRQLSIEDTYALAAQLGGIVIQGTPGELEGSDLAAAERWLEIRNAV